MKSTLNMTTSTPAGNPSDQPSGTPALRSMSYLWADFLRAQNAVDQCEGGLDGPGFDGLVQAVNDVTDEILSRDPANLYDAATQLRAILAGFETDGVNEERATPTLKQIERLLARLGAAPSGYEDASRGVCNGYWMLREYFDVLAPTSSTVTREEWNNHRTRMGWLIDRLGHDVDAVGTAMWGADHGRLALSEA